MSSVKRIPDINKDRDELQFGELTLFRRDRVALPNRKGSYIMARIAGVDLPRNKKVGIALTSIYGIGRTSASDIVERVNISHAKRANDLTENEINQIRRIIDQEYKVEGELRRETQLNIKRLMDIGSYRGFRHRRGLPVRGQRTSSNARTRKGKKKTVSVGRRAKELARRGR